MASSSVRPGWPAFILGLFVGVALTLLTLMLVRAPAGPGALPPRFEAQRFEALKGWTEDDHAAALGAFRLSCIRLNAEADDDPVGPYYGRASDWREACALAATVTPGDRLAARRFFETVFVPVSVQAGHRRSGLYTGYYEAELAGSRTRSEVHRVPLLKRPADLVTVDLSAFRDTFRGQRIAGRVEDGRLVPYADRLALEEAALADPSGAPVLLWVDSPVDAYFLQIQGSGRVRLDSGETVRVNFDGQNGFPATMIGRTLVERGAIDRDKVSMESIRAWLAAHPADAIDVLAQNRSAIFFRELPVDDATMGPPGAEGVALTPGRSLAVDLAVHGLGAPVWVESEAPAPGVPGGETPLHRLMVAQDTGGAIRGPVRGDVFWGFGDAAAALAGPMKARGQLTVLLPPDVAKALLAKRAR